MRKSLVEVNKIKVSSEVEYFVGAFSKAIEQRNAAIFAGAGLSIPAGFVDWHGLLQNIANDVGVKLRQGDDLIAIAQYHVNEKGGRGRINQLLVNEFSREAKATENHAILARLPINTYWTTNYDALIEEALGKAGKTADVKRETENLATNVPLRDAVVYKMHGDATSPHRAVVTKDDYENYHSSRQLFSTALQGDLVDKTFLFLGFSFSDPNVDYILSRIRVLLGENKREHYCLMRRVQRKDFKTAAEFVEASTRQGLQARDLKRFAVNVIFIERYTDITAILRMVEARIKRRRIFIGGSAQTYRPYGDLEAREFVHNLSKALVRDGFEVVTGFGLGVGDAVINGALEQVFSTQYRSIDRFLVMRPFPQFATGKKSVSALWTEYRNKIIDESGVGIFLFGNKLESEEIVDASGLIEEFEICLEKRIPVIPVGATGFVSGQLAERLLRSKKSYAWKTEKFSEVIASLNKPGTKLNNCIPKILKLVKDLQEQGY